MEGFSDVFNIFGVESSDRDTSVIGHVNRVLFSQNVNLFQVESSESKHTDLVSDMVPVLGRALLHDIRFQ